MANALWGQKHAVKPFRSSFVYSQWNYALATAIIETVTNETFGTYVVGHNIAVPHAINNDTKPVCVRHLNMTDDTGFARGYAARTTVKNLLILYQSLLLALAHESRYEGQSRYEGRSTNDTPFRNVKRIFSPHIGFGKATMDDVACCVGLYRTRLPNSLSTSSVNSLLLGLNQMPRIGLNNTSLKVFHHTGNVPGCFSSAFLIPSTMTAVVILTNALSLVDPTDLVGQLLVSQILDEQTPPDLYKLCHLARSASIASYRALNLQLEKYKTRKPPDFPLDAYEGQYCNSAGTFIIAIAQSGQGLKMTMQDFPLTCYQLLPYNDNTFYWPANRDAEIEQSMWPIPSPSYHKIVFGGNKTHGIDRLTWKHDPNASPEVFRRRQIMGKALVGKL